MSTLPQRPGDGLHSLAAMDVDALRKVQVLERALAQFPQVDLPTSHVIHAGLYARTIDIPAGAMLTGALIKRATLVIVSGECEVATAEGACTLSGFHVLPASAGRKQAFYARERTHITMIFPTAAASVEEAEAEFTDDAGALLSRLHPESNTITITGE